MVEDADILACPPGRSPGPWGTCPSAPRPESSRLRRHPARPRAAHLRFSVRPEDLRVVEAAIRRLGLEELALRNLDRMSGGELQKVCIARALVQEPRCCFWTSPPAAGPQEPDGDPVVGARGWPGAWGRGGHDHARPVHGVAVRDRFLFLQKSRVLAVCDREGLSSGGHRRGLRVPVSIEWIRDVGGHPGKLTPHGEGVVPWDAR
jgi:iron complex transport system ATP-binding protein